MTTTIQHHDQFTVRPAPTGLPHTQRGSRWALAGLVAGVLAVAGFLLAGVFDVSEEVLADNAQLIAAIEGKEWAVWAYQSLTVAIAAALVVFAAGLRRRLDEQAPVGSLLPTVAFTGLALTAAMNLVGGGICTELFWYLANADKSDPDTIAANFGIFNTMAWVWAGTGLTTASVAIASLRHGSFPRWLGWVSVVVTVLISLLQLVPLQYLALVPGALWSIVAGIGLARRERLA